METRNTSPAGVRTIKASDFKARCLKLMDEVADNGARSSSPRTDGGLAGWSPIARNRTLSSVSTEESSKFMVTSTSPWTWHGGGGRQGPGGRPLILLDTGALLWLRLGDRRLGNNARREIERAWQSNEVAVSAISFWQIAMLVDKGRIRLADDVPSWRREHLDQAWWRSPLTGEIGIRPWSSSISMPIRRIA